MHFWPNIGIFGPFDPLPNQKIMQTRCLGGFSDMWVPKLLPTPVKIWKFGPKTAKIGPKLTFLAKYWLYWSFWAKNWHFWPISSYGRPKNNANKVLRWFSVMWVPKSLLCQKNWAGPSPPFILDGGIHLTNTQEGENMNSCPDVGVKRPPVLPM